MTPLHTNGQAWPAWVRQALTCPACQAPLAFGHGALTCTSGSHVYGQEDPACVDLRHAPARDHTWTSRQRWMEHEYSVLLDDGDHAAVGFENDFRDIAALLEGYRGRILDVGGGIGIARHWLPSDDDYVLIEPSPMWRDARWDRFAGRFPCLARPCVHVQAYAEALPFASDTFDAALCLWSLNHVASVEASIRDVLRVLASGGRLLAVLEDAEPSWGDIRAGIGPPPAGRRTLGLAVAKLLKPLRGWAVQPDHIVVPERALLSAAGTAVLRREWRGLYLTVELMKL